MAKVYLLNITGYNTEIDTNIYLLELIKKCYKHHLYLYYTINSTEKFVYYYPPDKNTKEKVLKLNTNTIKITGENVFDTSLGSNNNSGDLIYKTDDGFININLEKLDPLNIDYFISYVFKTKNSNSDLAYNHVFDNYIYVSK